MEQINVYKNKKTGKLYCWFESDGSGKIDLYCQDDDTGASDLHNVATETLAFEFELVDTYFAKA